MIFTFESIADKHMRKQKWRKWFAWRPVWINSNQLLWLQTIWFHEVPAGNGKWRMEYSLVDPEASL